MELLENYNELLNWISPERDLEPLVLDKKKLSDRYHYHLQLSFSTFKEHNLLPSIRKGDKSQPLPSYHIDIYLDQIRSAHNIGSIVRTVEAFSLGEVHFSKNSPFIDNKKVQDSAMGTEKQIKAFKESELKNLKKPIIVLETSDEAIALQDFIFPESFTLVCGNEEYGCSDEVLGLADFLVEIPLRGCKNSLNVANAFAIAAYEIVSQNLKITDSPLSSSNNK